MTAEWVDGANRRHTLTAADGEEDDDFLLAVFNEIVGIPGPFGEKILVQLDGVRGEISTWEGALGSLFVQFTPSSK